MNRYRNAPAARGPTKATASTLCQKCLKRDIYECKVTAQERPYMARPSRTQQLQNPKLRPQLTTDTLPNDNLRGEGVADAILAKREEERGRKRDLDELEPLDGRSQASKRARSISSHSVSSVSTISTTRSRSESRRREEYDETSRPGSRAKSQSSRRSWSRKRRHSDTASNYTVSSYSSGERARSRSPEWAGERNTRRRRRESSPKERGRARNILRDEARRDRSRNRLGQISREKRSITPEEDIDERAHLNRSSPGSQARNSNHERGQHERPRPPPPRRDRSLSPYSKRLALTQAMNVGR